LDLTTAQKYADEQTAKYAALIAKKLSS
jgi:hypothetical protein